MITVKNYYEEIGKTGLVKSKLPEALKKGWEFIDKISLKGESWTAYETSAPIKKTVDLYLDKLNDHIKSLAPKANKKTKPKATATRSKKSKTSTKRKKVSTKETKPKIEIDTSGAKKVEALSPEIKFMKRFINMHEKIKTRNQIRLFINALQKAIREKVITKTSKYAKEIMEIQDSLIRLHGRFKTDNQREMVIYSDKTRSKYLSLIGRQLELQSVKFIKSYINLQGKVIPNQKAKNLHNRIANAVNKGKLSKKDKYWKEVESILDQLKTFVKKNPNEGILRVEKRALNGLQGIVSGCGCEKSLNGFSQIPQNTIMSSMDVLKLNFEKLGLKGKWLDLIGNPSRDFTAMVYGKPKMGKSYMSVDFAGYLARNHGTVLYVAKEEGIDDTLQEKLKDKNVAHPDLFVSDYLPEDLEKFDFVFLDSVTKLGLSPDDLSRLKERYPQKAFIYIFQTTKHGNFRGNNEFQHDVDVVIEVPEKGKAIQFGRFNQGGEMDIFGQ